MRYVKYALIAALILAIPASFVYGKRYEANRVAMRVNDDVISKRDLHIWLEDRWGPEMAKTMAAFFLVKQEATKQGWRPDPKRYEEQLQDALQHRPTVAEALVQQPWRRPQALQDYEANDALTYLQTHGVSATPDELKDYFASKPGAWDTPEQLTCRAVATDTMATAAKVKVMMESVTDTAYVATQFPGKAKAISGGGPWVLPRPAPTNDAMARAIVGAMAGMKIKEARVIKIGLPAAQALVVRLEDDRPARKASFDDPKVRADVETSFKLSRATSGREILHKLWDAGRVETDPPALRSYIELNLFPERATQRRASAN